MQKYYAIYIEKDISLVIPWSKPNPPELLEIAQTLSYVWGIVGTDISFGSPIKIEEVDVHSKESAYFSLGHNKNISNYKGINYKGI